MWRFMNAGRVNHSAFFFARRFYSAGAKKKPSLKDLAKEYGWTATGTYLALASIDLPLSFLGVHSAGQERLQKWELSVRKLVGASTDPEATYVHWAAAGGGSLFWAEFGIAYVIHKALIFVRLPLTAALTPKIAAKLGKWGIVAKRAKPVAKEPKLPTGTPK